MQLTSHERIMRIFQKKEIDRPALKLWGAGLDYDYDLLHPAYEPVRTLAAQKSDLFVNVNFPFEMCAGQNLDKYKETWTEETGQPNWYDLHTVYHTPKGDLHMKERVSRVFEPGFVLEHMIKEPEDIEKVLSMEYLPYPVDAAIYENKCRQVGDRGVVMVNVTEPGYIVHWLMGSETLAYFSVDCREEVQRMIDIFTQRSLAHVRKVLDAGVTAPFSWVGPELFTPPLMNYQDFQDFVVKADKPICDLIHNGGGYVWVHCHGKVANLVEDFIQMGVDILNPLEPPKNGDIHMGRIIEKFGNRIGWEGNIEIQDILLASPGQLRLLIDECVNLGKESGRFILCPSAGFNEYPFPTQQYIDNLLLYLNYGYEAVERCRKM